MTIATSIKITLFGERKPTIPDPGRFDLKTMDIDLFFGLNEAFLRQYDEKAWKDDLLFHLQLLYYHRNPEIINLNYNQA